MRISTQDLPAKYLDSMTLNGLYHMQPGTLNANSEYFFLHVQDNTLLCGLADTLPNHIRGELDKSAVMRHKEAVDQVLDVGNKINEWFGGNIIQSDEVDVISGSGISLYDLCGPSLEDIFGPLPKCPECL